MRARAVIALAIGALLATVAAGPVAAAPSSPVAPVPAATSTVAGFDPTNIISDALFYDAQAMTSAQIQAFLDAKIGTCTNGQCLNVASIAYPGRARQVSTKTGNLVCDTIAAGTVSAAELIYRAQVACGISAKVILVTLQKEQSLVTAKAPTTWVLQHAMSMACPDTAPCDTAFAGLGTQLVEGTAQLKMYKAGAFARQPGYQYVAYNPNASCGGTSITIQNYATAALYNYTPYQPNPAALANPDGGGDGCSSYGNLNFWRLYANWFGPSSPSVASLDRVSFLYARDGAGELWAYPTNGSSGWLAPVSLGTGWGGLSTIVGIGDLDGDGHRDLIGVDADGAWLYRGDGHLGFLPRTKIDADWSGAVRIVSAGDFTGDGIPDVFTIDAAGNLWLWAGLSSGQFAAKKLVGWGWGMMDLVIGTGDFSGDGRADLMARGKDSNLYFYWGDGHGGWAKQAQIGSNWGAMKELFAPGDFTGDGIPDLLGLHANGNVYLYPGLGGGLVTGAGSIGSGWGQYNLVASGGPAAVRRVPPPGAGDVSGDGIGDVLGLTNDGELRLYPTDGRGSWGTATSVDPSFGIASTPITMGDFSGDGKPDLGYVQPDGTFMLRPGNGAGGFGPPTSIGTGWGSFRIIIGGIDFNGDGKVDVMAVTSTGDLYFYAGDGAGGWLSGSGQFVSSGWGGMKRVVYAGDFTGDGNGDLLAVTSGDDLYLYPGTGASSFRPPIQIGVGWGSMSNIFVPGNFDGSGGLDVIGKTVTGELYLYRGNGAGGWLGYGQIGWGWNWMKWIG